MVVPIFPTFFIYFLVVTGNKADVTNRPDVPPSRASSRLSTASAQARLEIDEVRNDIYI